MAAARLKAKPPSMPVAALLTIGNELLTGRTLNTNASFLGSELTRMGFRVLYQQVCSDDIGEIKKSLAQLALADLLIVTGGLGPTPDDVTRDAIADYFQIPLKFSPVQFKAMSAIYRKLGRKVPKLSRLEAFYPSNAKPLVNRFGIALGFWIHHLNQTMIVLPGVPTELHKMFSHDVKPLLKKRFKSLSADKTLMVRMVGISEPRIIEKLGDDFFKTPFQFGIYPSEGETQICIRSPSQKIITQLRKKISHRLKGWVYSWGDESLAQLIGYKLAKKNKTMAIAESCTGGSLSFAWTQNSGASRFFRGGVTTYHREAKIRIGVSPKVIRQKGEVSAEVASELARAACDYFDSDYGIGVTGIAGPEGGSAKKPIGLVYIALCHSGTTQVEKHLFWGNREQIQRKAVAKSLELFWRNLFSV